MALVMAQPTEQVGGRTARRVYCWDGATPEVDRIPPPSRVLPGGISNRPKGTAQIHNTLYFIDTLDNLDADAAR